jgi:hypothetical protein
MTLRGSIGEARPVRLVEDGYDLGGLPDAQRPDVGNEPQALPDDDPVGLTDVALDAEPAASLDAPPQDGV